MEYLLTFGIGVLVIAVISLIVLGAVWLGKSVRDKSRQYDERQQRARGIAYRNGFITIETLVLLLCGMTAAGTRVELTLPLLVFCLMAGAGVFGVSCILMDAYLGLQEKPKTTVAVLALALAVNLLAFARNSALDPGGNLCWLNLGCAGLMAAMLAAMAVKSFLRRRENQEEDE